MNLIQIQKGLSDGSIKLDTKGHMTNPVLDNLDIHIKDDVDWLKQLETGSYTGNDNKKWTKKECEDFSSYLKSKLDRDYAVGQYISETEHYCFDCGKTLHLMVVDDNTISMVDYSTYSEFRQKNETGRWLMNPSDITNCSVKELRDEKKLVSEINVPSGELLFKNYFDTEKIYTMPDEYKSENSICSISGRKNLMKYLSNLNIGYAQMGNMSINVFLNKSGDEIIIGNDYDCDEDDNEIEVEHEGFKNLGSISLSVWRWMCGDLQVLREHGEKIPNNLKVNKQTEVDYKDSILTKVKPGIWVIEHYYDFAKNDDDKIYSRLYLKK